MGLIRRWFKAPLHAELERCAPAALAHVDGEQLDRNLRKQTLVIAFFLGAIDELARVHDGGDTAAANRLAQLLTFADGSEARGARRDGSPTRFARSSCHMSKRVCGLD
jgi:hypothetical protein